MGASKTELFTIDQNEMACLAKAFAHPARVAIIQYLAAADSCVNGDLVQELGLAQATISQHLAELKKVGIIMGSIEGPKKNYCIDTQVWERIEERFNELFGQHRYASQEQECC